MYFFFQGNFIYVCGGWGDEDALGARVLVDTIDRYDVETDTWETIARVPSPRYHSGIVPVQNKIYFIGGFHSDALFDRATGNSFLIFPSKICKQFLPDFVDCYDIETNSWSSKDKYPQDVWEHCCVTLYVPRCRNDMAVLPLDTIT